MCRQGTEEVLVTAVVGLFWLGVAMQGWKGCLSSRIRFTRVNFCSDVYEKAYTDSDND